MVSRLVTVGVRGAAFALLAALAAAAAAQPQPKPMTPERVREALAWGLQAAEADLDQYPLRTEKTWLVNFDTPFLRVAQFSRAMKIQNNPATEGDVSPKLAAEEVHVYAHARVDADSAAALPNIDYIVMVRGRKDTPGGETVLPISVQSFVRRVPNDTDAGRTRIARSVKAVFPLSALAAGNVVRLTFENGAIQTVTITPEALAKVR